MTPFPETELVTLERLEVALRDRNQNLLKEGAYKLHEKYHSGHKFEYLDKIKVIYLDTIDNVAIPSNIKDMLCSTIEDILSDNGIQINSYNNFSSPNRVSSLTKLSYNASAPQNATMVEEAPKESQIEPMNGSSIESQTELRTEAPKQEEKISAFDVFGVRREHSENSAAQSPFEDTNNAPFQEFSMPKPQPVSFETVNNYSISQPEEIKPEPLFGGQQTVSFEQPFSQIEETVPFEDHQSEVEEKLADIAVFYCQDISNEKIKNILRYRDLISKLQDEHHSINEILHLISEINIQSNTNILELKGILDQLRINKNKVNLVTNSSSADLIGLMEQGEYSYSLYERREDKQINLIPVFGLSNQFICSVCAETYLDKEDKINPLVLQCPKCKSPMFPNFYTANNSDIQINLDYYNGALMSLVDSDVWVVIHPVLEDKVMASLILSAMKLNTSLKMIYILDKDINTREEFKKRFLQIRDDIEVNTSLSALEDFLNSIR